MFDATHDDPEKAWAMLLDLIDASENEDALMRIGVGPFEDFISLTRRNPAVRRALKYASDYPHEPAEVDTRIRELIGPVDREPAVDKVERPPRLA